MPTTSASKAQRNLQLLELQKAGWVSLWPRSLLTLSHSRSRIGFGGGLGASIQ
jgi:hypothetical protein